MSDELVERLRQISQDMRHDARLDGDARTLREAADEIERLTCWKEEAEDFRSEIAMDAVTAPDADWWTILDSLRCRIDDLNGQGHRFPTVTDEMVERGAQAMEPFMPHPMDTLRRADAAREVLTAAFGGVVGR